MPDNGRSRGLPTWLGPASAVALSLWLTRGVWGPRPPAGDDVMAHLTRADFGLAEVVGRGRLDGWFPRFMLGHELFLVYGPGFTWLLGLVRVASFGTLSNTGALKVVAIGSIAALGPAMAFLARSLGLSRPAAGVAAVLAVAVNSPFGPGLAGTFAIGLVPHQVAAPLFCLGLGATARLLDEPHRRWALLLGASLAALLLTHLISVVLLVAFAVLVVAGHPATAGTVRRGFPPVAAAAVASSAVCAFWLVPFLAHGDLRGPVTTWGTPPFGTRLSEVVDGRILFAPRLGLPVVVAALYGVVLAARRQRFALVAWAPLGFLALAHWLVHTWPNDLTLQLANRGLGYAGLLALVPLAAVVAVRARGRASHAGVLVVALLAALAATSEARRLATQHGEPVPSLPAAARRLRATVPDGARFATERDFPAEIGRTGVSHPDLWLARQSGRNSLNVWNPEASPATGGFEPERLGRRPAVESADALSRLGVSHVVTVKDTTPLTLESSGRFRPVWSGGPLSILEVVPPAGQPPPAALITAEAGPLDAELLAADPEHLRLRTRAATAVRASLAVSWSPKWRLRVDGRPAPLGRTPDGLLRATVPAGTRRLALDLGPDGWNRAGTTVSVVAGLALVGAGARRYLPSSSRRSRRRSRTA